MTSIQNAPFLWKRSVLIRMREMSPVVYLCLSIIVLYHGLTCLYISSVFCSYLSLHLLQVCVLQLFCLCSPLMSRSLVLPAQSAVRSSASRTHPHCLAALQLSALHHPLFIKRCLQTMHWILHRCPVKAHCLQSSEVRQHGIFQCRFPRRLITFIVKLSCSSYTSIPPIYQLALIV